MTLDKLKAGASVENVTPVEPYFLFGYPYVERISTGVHDWLLTSALYLTDGKNQVLFISNDVIYLSKDSVARIRNTIYDETGIPISNILIAATHTHSGPVTVDCLNSANDAVVPKVDKKYLGYLEENIAKAAFEAFERAEPAEVGFCVGDATGVGTNRHNPKGPRDTSVPVMVVRNKNKKFIACMLACSMHPTVLHEDSTLYSSDFPFYVREVLQNDYLGKECPVIYFTGAAGNQSPRYVTKGNTFDEARRLGKIVADSVKEKLSGNIPYSFDVCILSYQRFVDLPKREFPSVESAKKHRDMAKEHVESLKKKSADPKEIRTAEVDWFGAEELLFFSTIAHSGYLDRVYKTCLPAEIQLIKVGDWNIVSWPGEIFVEYALEVKKRFEKIFLITLANGELQGYIATKEAYEKGFYEASNSLFDYRAGEVLVEETIQLLKEANR